MPSRAFSVYETELDMMSTPEPESGYASGSSSEGLNGNKNSGPEIFFTKAHLNFLNRQLQTLEPQGTICPTLVHHE